MDGPIRIPASNQPTPAGQKYAATTLPFSAKDKQRLQTLTSPG
jgi:hypothetical protein